MQNYVHSGWMAKKAPSTSFFPVTSPNVGIGPQNFATFSSKAFALLLYVFKAIPSTSPKLLNIYKGYPSKKPVFLVKLLQS